MHGSWDINKMAVGESAWFPKFYEPIFLEIVWICINDTYVFSKNYKDWVHSFFKNIREISFYTEIVCLKGEKIENIHHA